jgi:hypothetical protein
MRVDLRAVNQYNIVLPATGLLGQIVTSRTGRDAGRRYVVVAADGPMTALLADGRSRTVARPKRKNVKHLAVGEPVSPALAEKLAAGQPVSDEAIRAAITAAGA